MEPYAMVHGGYVVNVIMWDGNTAELRPPPGVLMVKVDGKFCGPGFKYNAGDGTFEPAPVMLPGTNYDK